MMEDNNPIVLPDFSNLHIVVIGDIMTDRYISGVVRRISPEAPVPVLDMETIENRPGGAANVAMNLLALGVKVTLISIVGDDAEGELLIDLCSQSDRIHQKIVKVRGRKTTVKTRVIAVNQQMLRIDHEDKEDINSTVEGDLVNKLKDLIAKNKVDGIILQDYNKGLLTEQLIRDIISLCKEHNIFSFVDPKEKNFFAYKGCTVFKPNKKEVRQAVGNFNNNYQEIATIIESKLQNKVTIITLGKEGIFIQKDLTGIKYATSPRVITDVCGAGDSVISIVSVCYLKGMDLSAIAKVANIAGGQVCEIPGVAVLNKDSIQRELESEV
ncbi:MAG: hypothetical protein IPO98_03620 [Saprospiraceae bacterium]|jgi:rfaE bifunctional protein kinase chain/domain|nr:hypothetical protein [Saprospiraceae bacterium]